MTSISQGVSEVRADEEPIAATEQLHPPCPLCGSQQTKFLCAVDHYYVWRCPASAVDFVHPVPTTDALDALYDRLEWFEGGERGGYVSYDSQTDPSPTWLVEMLERLAAERPDPSILDIGCAYGTHLGLARDKGWQTFGVEPSHHARTEARRRHPGLYVAKTIEEIPPHRFDLILILDVVEHLADPYTLFRELAAKDAIGPETIVILTTPNARSHDALVDPAGWVYRHPPSHLTYYSASALEDMLRRLRFASVEVRGQHRVSGAGAKPYADEASSENQSLTGFAGLLCEATECDLGAFMQERYIPGTWSEIAAYEHVPRYAFAAALAAGKQTLDFGCGSGYGAEMLAETASSVVGLDASEEALSYARSHHRRGNLSFLHDFGPRGGTPGRPIRRYHMLRSDRACGCGYPTSPGRESSSPSSVRRKAADFDPQPQDDRPLWRKPLPSAGDELGRNSKRCSRPSFVMLSSSTSRSTPPCS